MSEHIKSMSDTEVAEMREVFYKHGWGQNETMWKCWNQALNYLSPSIKDLERENAALKAKFAELEKQEPVANVVDIGERLSYRISVSINNPDNVHLGMKLYATPVISDLERKLLEARIDQVGQCENYNGVQLDALSESLHKQLAALDKGE